MSLSNAIYSNLCECFDEYYYLQIIVYITISQRSLVKQEKSSHAFIVLTSVIKCLYKGIELKGHYKQYFAEQFNDSKQTFFSSEVVSVI